MSLVGPYNENLIYDEEFYFKRYPYIQNEAIYYLHWEKKGKDEGNCPSVLYNPQFYLNKYPDLKKAYGSFANGWVNYYGLFNHFMNNGINERRASSEVFDLAYYIQNNPDLSQFNSIKAIEHFVRWGINEWRKTSPDFDVKVYKESNPDLVNAYGDNPKLYFYHFMIWGLNENRKHN